MILLEDDYSKRYEGFDPNSSESYIMFELLQNEFLEQSRSFADRVQNYFTSHAKRKDRGVRQAGFLVLRETSMPSVLIELGYMSNKNEKDFLEKESGRTLCSESIVGAISDYIEKYDKKNQKPATQTVPEKIVEVNRDAKSDSVASDSIIDIAQLKGTYYGIQIMATKNKLGVDDSFFKNQRPVYYFVENGYYKYFLGLSKNSSEVINMHQSIKKLFKDSFIVSFEDGRKHLFK